MSRSETFEKEWEKLEEKIIYVEKALNIGVFGGGYFYDFYQEKEAKSAEQFVMESNMKDCISSTNVLRFNNGFTELFRLTFVIDNEKVQKKYSS